MKALTLWIALGMVLLSAGCMSASKVQEMIDASHQDYLSTSKAHEKSINILQQSSAKALEQNEKQAADLASLQQQQEASLAQQEQVMRNSEAAKVMSAANTVKVAELSEAVAANHEAIKETVEKMETIDRLFEDVLIKHFENIIENTTEAIAVLRADDVVVTNGAATGLAAPIEIVAPDTSAPTNAVQDAGEDAAQEAEPEAAE